MNTAPGKKSTAASYKPTVRLTAHRGWYRVQSGTTPGVYYETSANSCNCPARKQPCKHQQFVRSLNVAFFVKKEASAPVASIDTALADAEQLLARKRRALADTHSQSDEYATLLREVDQAERQVAALSYSAMRAA
jgi:hypothetical protein